MEQWLSPFWIKLTRTLKIISTVSSLYSFALWSAEELPGRQAGNTFWTRFFSILILNVSGCEDAYGAVGPLTFHMPQFPWYVFCVAEIILLTRCIKNHREFCFWTRAKITSSGQLKCWKPSMNVRSIKVSILSTNFCEVSTSLLLNGSFRNGLGACFLLLLISTGE